MVITTSLTPYTKPALTHGLTLFLAFGPAPLGIPHKGALLCVDAEHGSQVLIQLEIEQLAGGAKHLGKAEGHCVLLVKWHKEIRWLSNVLEMELG